ncbi:phosphoserine phosphatase SerB [Naumannella sp. ID2617S]|nr:phosphoserine phosphatase SerB [Naumannella sp. ID2617S]
MTDHPSPDAVAVLISPVDRQPELAAIRAAVAGLGGSVTGVADLGTTPADGPGPLQVQQLAIRGVPWVPLRGPLGALAAAGGWDVVCRAPWLHLGEPLLVVLDVDSTLITAEVIELLAAHVGREAEVAAVTDRAMRGEIDFAESLHQRVRVLAGLPVSVFADVRAVVRPTPGVPAMIAAVNASGGRVGVVSGGFCEVVEPLAAELGIAYARANRLEVADGRLTGRVQGAVVDRAEKARALRRYAADAGVSMDRTVAIGDGANDLDMLGLAALGIAFNAKPAVRAAADASLSGGRLDVVPAVLGRQLT